jgi:hypothetical protein
MTGFLKTILASAAQGMKKRMAQPEETGCGPRMPKGSAFVPARRELARTSKSESGWVFGGKDDVAVSLDFSGGKSGFSVRQSSEGKGRNRPTKMMLLLAGSGKNFLTKKGLVV